MESIAETPDEENSKMGYSKFQILKRGLWVFAFGFWGSKSKLKSWTPGRFRTESQGQRPDCLPSPNERFESNPGLLLKKNIIPSPSNGEVRSTLQCKNFLSSVNIILVEITWQSLTTSTTPIKLQHCTETASPTFDFRKSQSRTSSFLSMNASGMVKHHISKWMNLDSRYLELARLYTHHNQEITHYWTFFWCHTCDNLRFRHIWRRERWT